MKPILYQVSKDWKQFRWYLLALWMIYAMAANSAVHWTSSPSLWHYRQNQRGLTELFSILAPLAAIALSLLIVWSEAPSNPLGYSRTKPWHRGKQAFAKWLFIFPLVFVPLALASLAAPNALGMSPHFLGRPQGVVQVAVPVSFPA